MDFAYVLLPDDQTAHRLTDSEETACGKAVPMNNGAELLVDAGDDKCPECFPNEKKARSGKA